MSLSTNIIQFIYWYNNEFKTTEVYRRMGVIKEGSPYHREESIAIHTDMVVMSLISSRDAVTCNHETLCALFAAAFHDTGKPDMREEKYTTERGTYYAFHGHEVYSARLWEAFYTNNEAMLSNDIFDISSDDAYAISVMIENHRPWDITDRQKLKDIIKGLTPDMTEAYFALLFSDTAGRIKDSDGYEDAIKFLDNYVRLLVEVVVEPTSDHSLEDGRPVLYIPVGVSGAGKSTLRKKLLAGTYAPLGTYDNNIEVQSMDDYRMQWYDPNDYGKSFKMANDDPEFSNKVMAEFFTAIKADKNVYLDNTNLSRRRRRNVINEARRRGYKIVCFALLQTLPTLLHRAKIREDKKIDASVIHRQYKSMSIPVGGEYDKLIVLR